MVIVIFRISEIGLVFIALEVLRLKSSGVDRQGSVLGGKNSVVFFLAKEQKEISSLVRVLTERGMTSHWSSLKSLVMVGTASES